MYEKILLPDIHENTRIYSGQVTPDDKIMCDFLDAEKLADQSTDDPAVSKDGYFTVNLNAFEFKAGQDIRVYITQGYPHE